MAALSSINIKFSVDLEQFSTAIQNASRDLKKAGAEMQNVGKNMSMYISGPILALGGLAVKSAADFEKAMSEVKAVSSDLDPAGFEALSNAALDLGKRTSKSATEAAQGLKFLALAGFTVEQQLAAIEPVLRLSEAGGIELARASDLATDAMSALGIEAQNLGGFLDIIANTSTKSNTSIEQLNEAFIAVGGQFKNLNVPLDEANALLGILANRGIKGSEAGNGLSTVLINLTSGAGQAGVAMRQLGISAFDSEGNFRGVSTILNDLNEKFATMTVEQQSTYKAMIGGKTRITELNALLDGTANEFDKLRDSIIDSDGKLLSIAETMQDNFNGQLIKMKSALEGVGIQIGNILLPYLKRFVEGLNGVVDWFANLNETAQKIILVIAGIAAAIGPLLLIFGSLASLLPTIIAGVSALGTAFTIMTGPIGLIIVAVGALIYLLVKNWEAVKRSLVDTANYFIDLYNESMAVRAAVQYIILGFKQLFTAGKLVVNLLINGFKLAARTIVDSFKNIGTLVKAVLTGDFKAIPGILANAFKGQVDNVKNFVKEGIGDVKAFATDTASNIKSAIDATLKNDKIKYVTAENVDKESLKSGVQDPVALGVEDGVANGIAKGIAKAGNVLKEGTAAFFEKQISDLKEIQSTIATTNLEWLMYQQRIDEVQVKLDELKKPLQSLADLGIKPIDTKTFLASTQESMKIIRGYVTEYDIEKQRMDAINAEFGEAMSSIMEQTAENLAVGFGELIGAMAAGAPVMQSIYTFLMSNIAALMEQLGKAAIQIGITMSAIKASFKTPFAAIAAGVALIALSSLVKSLMPKEFSGGGGAPAFANGGIVPGNSFYGDKIWARLNSGELVLNGKQQQQLWGMMNNEAGGVNVALELGTKISGSDIELVVNRAINRNKRTR